MGGCEVLRLQHHWNFKLPEKLKNEVRLTDHKMETIQNLSPQNLSKQNLSNNKLIKTKLVNYKTYQTTKLIKLQNLSTNKTYQTQNLLK